MPGGMVLISTQIIPSSGSTIVLIGIEPEGRFKSEQIKFGFGLFGPALFEIYRSSLRFALNLYPV